MPPQAPQLPAAFDVEEVTGGLASRGSELEPLSLVLVLVRGPLGPFTATRRLATAPLPRAAHLPFASRSARAYGCCLAPSSCSQHALRTRTARSAARARCGGGPLTPRSMACAAGAAPLQSDPGHRQDGPRGSLRRAVGRAAAGRAPAAGAPLTPVLVARPPVSRPSPACPACPAHSPWCPVPAQGLRCARGRRRARCVVPPGGLSAGDRSAGVSAAALPPRGQLSKLGGGRVAACAPRSRMHHRCRRNRTPACCWHFMGLPLAMTSTVS